jgi:transposase
VNGAAKIDVPRVQVIRSCVAEGESKTAIAQALGVSRSLVSLIARRKIWAHVPEEGAE